MNREEMTEIQHLEKQLRDVDTKVSSILVLLKGSDLDKTDNGMIGEQFSHEKRILALEKMKDRIIYFLVGLSIPAGWGLIDIIQNIVFKK